MFTSSSMHFMQALSTLISNCTKSLLDDEWTDIQYFKEEYNQPSISIFNEAFLREEPAELIAAQT